MTRNEQQPEEFERIRERIVAYQEECLEREGDSPKGVDWNSRDAQQLAFRVIKSMGIGADSSVLDVGCGLAHFYDFLIDGGYTGAYTGVDISHKLVAEAKRRQPHLNLIVADILNDTTGEMERGYDFVIGSGLFTLKADAPAQEFERFVAALIRRMFKLSRVGVVFNMLSSYVDFEVERLYYANPQQYFRFAKSLTRFVSLKHDYPSYFFTMALYQEGNDYTR